MKRTNIEIGSIVRYSAKFLKSTGIYTGAICFAEGEVRALRQLGSTTLAEIHWNTEGIPSLVNLANLCLAGKPDYSAM
jgi:hypothetical protein